MQWAEHSLRASIPSLHHVGLRDQAQGVSLDSGCLYLQSHIANLPQAGLENSWPSSCLSITSVGITGVRQLLSFSVGLHSVLCYFPAGPVFPGPTQQSTCQSHTSLECGRCWWDLAAVPSEPSSGAS